MKRLVLAGIAAQLALASASCGDSPKTLLAEVRYRLGPHQGVQGCPSPYPSYNYTDFDGAAVDGSAGIRAACRATQLSSGVYSLTLGSYTDVTNANGIGVTGLVVDTRNCDPTTGCPVVDSASCRVTVDVDNPSYIARFQGNCSSAAATVGTCQITNVVVDRKNADGKTVSLRVYCLQIKGVDDATMQCDLHDSDGTMMSEPAYLRFSNCTGL